jgi:hypothetical protein
MTEKEFLIKYIDFYLHKTSSEQFVNSTEEELAGMFLEQHHKEYYEVEFIKIEDEDLLAEQNREYNDMIARSLRRT